MFTSRQSTTILTPEERYDRKFTEQRGICASCRDIVVLSRLIVPTMTFANDIVPDAPEELICHECATALKAAQKSAEERRMEYIERYT